MDLFTVPNAAKTQNLKDLDAVGLRDALDTVKSLVDEGVSLARLKAKMVVALADSNSGKLLTEGYDQDVLKAGESMHQLWRSHESKKSDGNPTSMASVGLEVGPILVTGFRFKLCGYCIECIG